MLVFVSIAVGFQQGLGRLFDATVLAQGVLFLRLVLPVRQRTLRLLLGASLLREQRAEILEKAAIRFLYPKRRNINDNKLNYIQMKYFARIYYAKQKNLAKGNIKIIIFRLFSAVHVDIYTYNVYNASGCTFGSIGYSA